MKHEVLFRDQKILVEHGENLRKVLLEHELSPHNGTSQTLNCRGMGTCGTCALKIKGDAGPLTKNEKLRLNLPPHSLEQGLRLSCQCKVIGDLELIKGEGFWGQSF